MITNTKVKAWMDAGKDNYEIAQALIDSVIGSHAPVSLGDLPDTATVASEIEAIVECLEVGDIDDAINISIESAQIILEEEGFDINSDSEKDN
jgi:hypothetical protein